MKTREIKTGDKIQIPNAGVCTVVKIRKGHIVLNSETKGMLYANWMFTFQQIQRGVWSYV